MQADASLLIHCSRRAACLAGAVTSALALSPPALALPLPADGIDSTAVSQMLVLAVVSGVILAAAGAMILLQRAAGRARRNEAHSAEAMKALRQELDVAQSIVMAEPQVLVAFEADGAPRMVNHALDVHFGIPVKLRNLMRFASWLERGAAISLERHLQELKSAGRPFEMTLKTLAGPHIEAEGRASGGGYYLKFRDLAGRRTEMANLLRQQRASNEELATQKALLDALPMPIWFRDPEGRLIWVNRAYVSAVEAARTDEVIEEQRELLEARQRRAADTSLAAGETFRKRYDRGARRPGERGCGHRRGAARRRSGQALPPDGRA
jgi:PAS domain-containing protein